jgi:hypothetical protein
VPLVSSQARQNRVGKDETLSWRQLLVAALHGHARVVLHMLQVIVLLNKSRSDVMEQEKNGMQQDVMR